MLFCRNRRALSQGIKLATAICIAAGLVLGIVSDPSAQGRVPRPIPADLSESTRTAIERLFADSAVDRGYAARYLGGEGAAAAAAIPFLWNVILLDHAELVVTNEQLSPVGGKFGDTSPAREAARALKSVDANWTKSAETLNHVLQVVEMVRDGRVEVRRLAVELLAEIADLRGLNALASALRDPDEEIRRGAARGLGQIGDAGAVPSLIGALKDPQFYVKWDAVEALGKIRDPRAVGPLLDVMQRENRAPYGLVSWSAEALQRMGEPAVQPLIDLLRRVTPRPENRYLRVKVVESLGVLKDKRAIGVLKLLADTDSDADVKAAAADELKRLGT
jgi:HEAT repeat protein